MPEEIDREMAGAGAPGSYGGAPATSGFWPDRDTLDDGSLQDRAAMAIFALRDADPDRAAAANILARETGFPADFVERNFATIQAKQRAMRNIALVRSNPMLGRWAANPRNAAAAIDDLTNLDALSRRFWQAGAHIDDDYDDYGAGLADDAMSLAARTRLWMRDPEGFRQYVATHTEGTPFTKLFVPAAALDAARQVADPAANGRTANWLALHAGRIDEATALDTDVPIPLDEAVTHLAGSDLWPRLRHVARTTQRVPATADDGSGAPSEPTNVAPGAAPDADHGPIGPVADQPGRSQLLTFGSIAARTDTTASYSDFYITEMLGNPDARRDLAGFSARHFLGGIAGNPENIRYVAGQIIAENSQNIFRLEHIATIFDQLGADPSYGAPNRAVAEAIRTATAGWEKQFDADWAQQGRDAADLYLHQGVETVMPITAVGESAYQLFSGRDFLGDPVSRGEAAGGVLIAGLGGGLATKYGRGILRWARETPAEAEQKAIAKFMGQGFSRETAEYLAQPYYGMGHHFIPRRSKLPRFILENRFNVLKPRGINRGDMYELHFRVDPEAKGFRLPGARGKGSGWSGQRLGLKKYGRLGRLWYGSPRPLKVAAGTAAAGTGGGAYELMRDGD